MRTPRWSSSSLALLAALAALAVLQGVRAVPQQVPLGSHPCSRPCAPGRTMTCRYDFHVENYHSMSKACYSCPWNATDCARPDCIAADGASRALVVVNRMLPGPSLQVCLGDRLEVTVHNHMPEQSTSVHWHGLQQHGTPYMDGVPFVTQCPVQPHSAFRYSFRADNAGTHFWHSHTGCQRADGALGMLTVRVPKVEDPHGPLYDEDLPEHGILVWDWTHTPAASKFLAHHHAGDDNKADSVLINGKGAARRFPSPDGSPVLTPREVFTVTKGLRYRFRLINAGFLNCPLELSIDNHTLLVVASDGADVKPVRVDSLVSYAGERWDVVVEADQPVANYWLRMHGLLDCGPRRAHEAAVLRYAGADPNTEPAGPPPSYDVHSGTTGRTGLQVNPLNRGSADPNTITAAELQALPEATQLSDPALKPEADVQLFVSYDFYAVDNPHIHRAGLYGISQVPSSPHRVFTPQLNHISLSLPAFPLLPGRDRLDAPRTPTSPQLCNETSLAAQGRDCTKEYCECTHVVRVPLGGVLEIVLVDQGVRYDANHPFHLHGHAFRVVALERLGSSINVSEVQRLDAEGRIPRNLRDPPAKDTVTVPDGGYTVLRVHADNPGYWLFHCHIEFHVELGMALVVKVGEHEDMPPVPKGFPQCGDWSNNNWLGDADKDVDVDEVLDAALGDKPVVGNHIGRDLGALQGALTFGDKAGPPPAPLPSSTPRTTTSTTAATTAATTPTTTMQPRATEATEATEATDIAETMMSTPSYKEDSTEVADADDTTELLLVHGADGTLADDASRYGVLEEDAVDSTTEVASADEASATEAPTGARHVSEFIMRVSSSSRRVAQSEAVSVSHERWDISDPARPDLQYNVLETPSQAPRQVAALTASSPREARAPRDHAYALAGRGPVSWTPLVATLVCLVLAL
ncbi:laccase-like isoform X2 [Thrips palmi]|uniref:Laccase-like isoform X2 n=1 Tax=Thrips palmi TaxID=161013 RepID=A0A6P9AD37_THRPL|nr:laccase-like isoform X2 [Thrips palmi]